MLTYGPSRHGPTELIQTSLFAKLGQRCGMWFVANSYDTKMCTTQLQFTSLSLSLFLCSECVSMMLLPSGRSNSDVYPLQNVNTTAAPASSVGGSKPLLLTRTSSPQLTTLQTLNGGGANAHTALRSNSSAAFAATLAQETAGSLSGTGTQATATTSATASTTTTTTAIAATATTTANVNAVHTGFGTGAIYGPILGPNQAGNAPIGNWGEIDRHLDAVQDKLKAGWTVHVAKDGRLYYCK